MDLKLNTANLATLPDPLSSVTAERSCRLLLGNLSAHNRILIGGFGLMRPELVSGLFATYDVVQPVISCTRSPQHLPIRIFFPFRQLFLRPEFFL